MKQIYFSIILLFCIAATLIITSCDDSGNLIITAVELTAKDRLDSANAQSTRKYGAGTSLVLIFGKNVKSNGKTEIANITNVDSVGAWLYIYRVPGDTAFKIYTPNPIPSTSDCIELTAFFNPYTFINLIQDTSAQNLIAGALALISQPTFKITTSSANLLDSPDALNLANTTNPIIKFDTSYQPSSSSQNGNSFFSSGTNQKQNMFLIPAVGTLNLPQFIVTLTGFPPDLWMVNYTKTNSSNQSENLVLGTVVESSQTMSIPQPVNLQSKVINLNQ